MSNLSLFAGQVVIDITFISALFVLYRLLVKQKDSTIELLREKNQWLSDQLRLLQQTNPDILLERKEKRLLSMERELKTLNEDVETNAALIRAKEQEHTNLMEEISILKSRIDECPHCGAELTALSVDDEELRVYGCGYSTGLREHPCPFDPDFPTLDDYELRTKHFPERKMWLCFPEPKTEMAEKLKLDIMKGRSEGEAILGVHKAYAFHARNVPKPT